MKTKNQTVMKLAQTALLAALCFVSFTFLQIKIPMPGGDATSLHIGNAFCVLGALYICLEIQRSAKLAKDVPCSLS